MANLIIFVENCIADAQMLIVKAIFTCLVLAVLLIAILGVSTAFADDSKGNPENKYTVIHGTSIIADNFYRQNGNYDIQYDGETCLRWLRNDMPVVVSHPRIITYTTPVDDFDLIYIIACEA